MRTECTPDARLARGTITKLVHRVYDAISAGHDHPQTGFFHRLRTNAAQRTYVIALLKENGYSAPSGTALQRPEAVVILVPLSAVAPRYPP